MFVRLDGVDLSLSSFGMDGSVKEMTGMVVEK